MCWYFLEFNNSWTDTNLIKTQHSVVFTSVLRIFETIKHNVESVGVTYFCRSLRQAGQKMKWHSFRNN